LSLGRLDSSVGICPRGAGITEGLLSSCSGVLTAPSEEKSRKTGPISSQLARPTACGPASIPEGREKKCSADNCPTTDCEVRLSTRNVLQGARNLPRMKVNTLAAPRLCLCKTLGSMRIPIDHLQVWYSPERQH